MQTASINTQDKEKNSPLSLRELISLEIESEDFELPVFNPVAMKIQEMTADEDICISRLENCILEDPSLVTQILKTANSSFYRGLGDIKTMKEATTRLGLEQITNITIMLCQKNSYTAENDRFLDYMQRLWKHSVVTAEGCRYLAKMFGSDTNVAFLSGLLHDIGKLVVFQALDRIQSRQNQNVITETAMDSLLESALPSECGLKLIEFWHLPSPYNFAVQESPDDVPAEFHVLTSSIQLMDLICDSLDLNVGPKKGTDPSTSRQAEILKLNDIQIAEIEIYLEDEIEKMGL